MAKKPKLVKMVWPEPEKDLLPSEWRVADVHPDEVESWQKTGWRLKDGD